MVWLWFGKVLQVCFPYRQKLHVFQCGNRFYGALTFCLTLSTTLMLVVCVFSDCWEISVYDLASIYNLTAQDLAFSAATQDRTTCRKMVDQLPSDKGILLKSYQISSEVGWSAETSALLKNASTSNEPVAYSSVSCPNIVDGVNDNVFTNGSVVLPETGGIWRLCLQMSDDDRDFLRKICGQVYPQRCFYYLYETYTLCCKKCQYTVQEFNDLDDMYLTPYGTHYSTISFVFVSLLLHCVCYVLISIVAYKRIVTVVMMTGILFVLSGVDAFSLTVVYKLSYSFNVNW
uniref:Uncharacterized protein n=1 Tax=Romanomermis culicivorax TaxID=13658 RepID=A0A915IUQ3_ROMCU